MRKIRVFYAYLCDSNGKILLGAKVARILMNKNGTSRSKNIKLIWKNTDADKSTKEIYYRVTTCDGIEFPVKESGFQPAIIKKGDTLTAYTKQIIIV